MQFSKIALILLVSLMIPALSLATWSTEPTDNNLVVSSSDMTGAFKSVEDGSGGTYLVWTESASPDYNDKIFAQHLDADGNLLWAQSGVAACSYASDQSDVNIASDMAGGLLIVWRDEWEGEYDIYAQRISSDGTLLWPPGGQQVVTSFTIQYNPNIAPDHTGGCIVSWTDEGNEGDIYAQRLRYDGYRQWPSDGILVSNTAGYQNHSAVIEDSAGGAIIYWLDDASNPQVYANHINSLGELQWGAGGKLLADCILEEDDRPNMISDTAGGYILSFVALESSTAQLGVQRLDGAGNLLWGPAGLPIGPTCTPGAMDGVAQAMISDGLGGAFIVWDSNSGIMKDVVVHHIDSSGSPTWGSAGVNICHQEDALFPSTDLVSDGAGGVVVCWSDRRSGKTEASVYAQRLDASGGELWASQGNILCVGNAKLGPYVTSDGQGGLVASWRDYRDLSSYQYYAQNILNTGFLGYDPSAGITAVADFPNDQGGKVTVNWLASYRDAMPLHEITSYSVWTRLEGAKQASALDTERLDVLASNLNMDPEKVVAYNKAGWMFVEQVPAMLEAEYACMATTFGDSTSQGIIWSEYRVVAHTQDHWIAYESQPVSGFSVDNLTPCVPLALAGQWQESGELSLSWQASGYNDEDLALYNIYRGTSREFSLDAEHLIGTSFSEIYVDAAGSGQWFYRVTAMDVHFNESAGSEELEMSSVSGVAVAVPREFVLQANYPNPFNPRTTISFALPQAEHVELVVYSMAGTRIATLVRGAMPAGRHDINWQGTDDHGREIASGVYAYRLTAGDFQQTRSMVLLR